MRVGFLSDLHITNNVAMIELALDSVIEVAKEKKLDKLFIAGDTSNNYNLTLEFVGALNEAGVETYTIFGNHEYWSLSYEKALAIENDSYISGKVISLNEDTVVIGIDGYYDYSFVLEVENLQNLLLMKSVEILTRVGENTFDLRRNKIEKEGADVFNSMMVQLTSLLDEHKDKEIILMTHYVPSSEFVSYTGDRTWDSNNSFMGSIHYQRLAEEYGVSKVIFGHTHSTHNKVVNGVSYHCNPIGYSGSDFGETFRDRVKEQLLVINL